MRAVWWKEVRELLAPVIVLAVLGGIYVAAEHWGLSLGNLFDLAAVGGIALGLAQGVLDRLAECLGLIADVHAVGLYHASQAPVVD